MQACNSLIEALEAGRCRLKAAGRRPQAAGLSDSVYVQKYDKQLTVFSYASGGGSTSAAAASDNFVATSRHHSDDEAAVEASSEPRKKERKLLQVPGGSAPRELADLARLRQSLRTKMSPPLALT